MSKTIEEIKNEYAKELGYSSWINIGYNADSEKRNNEVAQRYAQSQTQELQEQNEELVRLLEYIFYKTNFQNHFPTTSIKVKNLLSKYNHLK